MQLFLRWAILFLGILGMIQFGELISLWMRRPKHPPTVITVLPLSGTPSNLELLLGYFQEAALWSPECQLAFVLDCGLSDASARECRSWCENRSRLIFCTQKEFEEICKGLQDTLY